MSASRNARLADTFIDMRTILLLLVAVFLAKAQSTELIVHTDLACQLLVDGQSRGAVTAGTHAHLSPSPGEHRIEAIATDGAAHWEQTVIAESASPQHLDILVRAAGQPEPHEREYWQDPNTHIIWAASDNGSGVSWSQAAYYCRALGLGAITTGLFPRLTICRAWWVRPPTLAAFVSLVLSGLRVGRGVRHPERIEAKLGRSISAMVAALLWLPVIRG